MNLKEKTMNLFPKECKPKDYKPKKIAGAFDGYYVKCKSEVDMPNDLRIPSDRKYN